MPTKLEQEQSRLQILKDEKEHLEKELELLTNESESIRKQDLTDKGNLERFVDIGNQISSVRKKLLELTSEKIKLMGTFGVLFNECLEVEKSENSYRNTIKQAVDTIKKSLDVKSEGLLQIYQGLVNTGSPFGNLTTEDLFLQQDPEKAITQICNALSEYLNQPGTLDIFKKAAIQTTELSLFIADQKIPIGLGDNPAILMVQRAARYQLLLETIIKRVEKIKEISQSTKDLLHNTQAQAKEFGMKVNREIARVQEENTKKLLKAEPEIAELLTRHGIVLSITKTFSEKEAKKAATAIANAIKKESPEAIIKTLETYGFEFKNKRVQPEYGAGELIKRDFYISNLNSGLKGMVENVMNYQGGVPLRTSDGKIQAFHATTSLKLHQSTTLYFIEQLNKAYQQYQKNKGAQKPEKAEQNLKQIGEYLQKLGLNEDQKQRIITHIGTGIDKPLSKLPPPPPTTKQVPQAKQEEPATKTSTATGGRRPKPPPPPKEALEAIREKRAELAKERGQSWQHHLSKQDAPPPIPTKPAPQKPEKDEDTSNPPGPGH